MAEPSAKFTFVPLVKTFNSIDGKENQEYFLKWSLKNRIKAKLFTFDQIFQAYEKDKFVLDFFRDPSVVSKLEVVKESGETTVLGSSAARVSATVVPCTVLTMAFFDKLLEGKIASESGEIKKCYDDFKDGFTISDNLRQMLLNEDSDYFCEFNEKERSEFLFLLFSHLCLGGQLCQYEDNVNQYLNITKAVYKDLISVQKNPETKELSIISHVFKVECYDDQGQLYFPSSRTHLQDLAYLILDPVKKTVICLSSTFGTCL